MIVVMRAVLLVLFALDVAVAIVALVVVALGRTFAEFTPFLEDAAACGWLNIK